MSLFLSQCPFYKWNSSSFPIDWTPEGICGEGHKENFVALFCKETCYGVTPHFTLGKD